MHSDSVWSLYSDHPQLATFYGGSKDGLVTKTEINRYDDEDPGQCVVICKAETGVARVSRYSRKIEAIYTSISGQTQLLTSADIILVEYVVVGGT